MVIVCTVLAAFAQVLLKMAADHPMPPIQLSEPVSILSFIAALASNLPLIFGYTLHAGNALLLILALRDGHLSVLYPVYSLSYIWVNLLSVWLFHEQMNGWKIGGVALIIFGVGMLGRVSSFD
jgi:multidrug transporter EmrE-like cation transporter